MPISEMDVRANDEDGVTVFYNGVPILLWLNNAAAAFTEDFEDRSVYLVDLWSLGAVGTLSITAPGKASVDGFMPVIEQNIAACTGGMLASWQYLMIHADMLKLLAPALSAKCTGETETALALFAEYEKYVRTSEPKVYNVLDVFENLMMLRGVIERK
jgi:hypothetical protein